MINTKELLENYKTHICSLNIGEIDPDNEYTWEALFVGMAIAYGFKAKKAKEIYWSKAYKLEDTPGALDER
jgi:hypothetical protein